MIYYKLDQWREIPGMEQHEIWRTAFTWLENISPVSEEGVYPLGRDNFFARIMSYPLKTREEAKYESHRETIDIQCTLQGAEGIEVTSVSQLQPLNDYSQEKEVEHYITPVRSIARIDNIEGWFSVFFAGEPHLPQLLVPGFTEVRKVVVKIPLRMLG